MGFSSFLNFSLELFLYFSAVNANLLSEIKKNEKCLIFFSQMKNYKDFIEKNCIISRRQAFCVMKKYNIQIKNMSNDIHLCM
jgi:hypothetical protein